MTNWYDNAREVLCQEVREAIAILPPIYQEVIELHVLEGWRIRRIAEEMNLAQGTVLSRIHKAKNRLRKRFA